MKVFILLFNARTENEGIHTLHREGRDTVLMFEAEDDATRYGLLLEAQDFPSPTVEAIDDEEVKDFCASAGYGWELIPEGALAIPPEHSLEALNWHSEDSPVGADSETEASDFSQQELEAIRRRLEGLL
jgi:hypothetical protein